MARILITGIAGFLGSHLAHYLIKQKHEVLGVDLVHPQEAWRVRDLFLLPSSSFSYTWASVADISPLLEHCDVVVHCAAVTDVAMASRSPMHAVQAIATQTAHLMEAAQMRQKRVVNISTHSVYGIPEIQGHTYTELSPLQPSTLYGALKAAAELIAMSYSRQYSLPVTTLRMVLMYGEKERSGALVSSFLKRALAGEAIRLDGGGGQTRDLLYVQDALSAIDLCLNDNRTFGEVYNVSTEKDTAIKELAEKSIAFAAKYIDTPGYTVPAPARAGEEGRLGVSSEKIRALGWLPLYSFEEGFDKTSEWVREERQNGGHT